MKKRMTVWLGAAALVLAVLVSAGCDRLMWAKKGIKLESTFLHNQRRVLCYASSVSEEVSWEDMEKYAKTRRWRERGITIVMFFDAPENTPDISQVGWNWNRTKYDQHLVAVYFRDKHRNEFFLEGPVDKRDVPFDGYMAGEDI